MKYIPNTIRGIKDDTEMSDSWGGLTALPTKDDIDAGSSFASDGGTQI